VSGFPILSTMLVIPAIGALACLFASAQTARFIALAATLVDLVLGIVLWASFDIGGAQWQFVEYSPVFGRFAWALGIDGFALMLIMLSVFLMPICIGASWRSVTSRVPEYMAAFLFTEVLMLGTFAAQDLFLFYVFFEAGLIPMFLIIGIWGGANRIYASYKFFLYTLLGSLLMLVAMLYMAREAGTTSIPALQAFNFDPRVQTWLWLAFFASFDVAGSYLAARRARPGADCGLGDPRRRAAEARRLRLPALFTADVPGGIGAANLADLHAVGGRGNLHKPRRTGSGRHEEADRLQFGRAHGDRHHRPLRL
jgi:NADH:ubiquinone oxidoreductase subunit 4 (subunit M)